MDHQPHLKYAIPRLKERDQTHWFDGDVKPHWRPDLIELFDKLLGEAEQAGFLVANYDGVKFGAFEKLSQKGYKANHGFDPKG
jgi:hypothetical protein